MLARGKLTSSFSLSSLASRSFLNRSLISRSLTTHAAASVAAASGRDLFFSKSTVAEHVSSLSLSDRTHQRRGSRMHTCAHVRGQRNTARTETRQPARTQSVNAKRVLTALQCGHAELLFGDSVCERLRQSG